MDTFFSGSAEQFIPNIGTITLSILERQSKTKTKANAVLEEKAQVKKKYRAL